MKKNYALLIILGLALALRLPLAFTWHEIWWDEGVYIGMGKYIYSGGTSGLFEHIRPPLLPFILGFFWKLGLDPVIFGRLAEILLMLGIIWLTYLISKQWWNETVALIAALIVALSPIFYYLSFHQYNEIPSTFFVLLAVWLCIKQKHFWSGISAGLAFLSKFAPGMFIAIIIIYLLINKKWKPAILTGAGFAIPVFPYFIWSWITYGNPLATFLAAQQAIAQVLGCNVLRYKPWWQYFWWLAFSETKLHFLAIPGIVALKQNWKKQHLLFILSLTIPFLYFMQLNCRDYRYITLFLPFAAMLTSLGVIWVYQQFKPKRKWILALLIIFIGIWMLRTSLQYYYGNEAQQPDQSAEGYLTYLKNKDISGEIWTANPIITVHTDAKLEKIYYPIFDGGSSKAFTEYLTSNYSQIGAVLLDNCGGGIICPPYEIECPAKTEQLIQELDRLFMRKYDKQTGQCWYRIWTTSSSE